MDFSNKYRRVFSKDGTIKACGRETCKELIKICKEKYPDVDFGNEDTGMMNVSNIKNVYKLERKDEKHI